MSKEKWKGMKYPTQQISNSKATRQNNYIFHDHSY